MVFSTFGEAVDAWPYFTTKALRIMRLTAFFVLAAALHISAKGVAQKVSISLNNEPLVKAFSIITAQTDYHFVVTDSIISNSRPVSLDIKNGDLQEVLQRLFADQPIAYRLTENPKLIILSLKPTRIDQSVITPPQVPPHEIRGTVLDEKGNPLSGVSVSIKGTQKGTFTDARGEFRFADANSDDVLILSHIGYEKIEYRVRDKSEIVIRFKVSANSLTDVSVELSTGYQNIPKERATGSFDFVDSKLFNRAISTDVISRLNGIASGVLFDNTAGNPANLQIRGMSTIQSNTEPLIVLNNFPYDGDLQSINPNDVESITILKDAAAASIWGVRAGNGAIVITTKSGHLNQNLHLEVNSNITTFNKPNLFYDPNFLDASDFINVEEQLFSNGYYNSQLTSKTKNPVSPVVNLLNMVNTGQISSADANTQIDAFKNQDIRNDLKKYFYQNQLNQQYSVSLFGGTTKSTYYFSGGYDKNLVSQVGSNFQRVTLNASDNYSPIKNLEISANLSYAQSTNNTDNTLPQINTGGPNSLGIYPYAQLADAKGNALPIVKDYQTAYINSTSSQGFLNWQFYPLTELRQGYNKTNVQETYIRSNAGLKYTIINGLSVQAQYQYERTLTNSLNDATSNSYYARNLINRFSILTNGKVTGYNVPTGDILNYGYTTMTAQNFRFSISENRTINEFAINSIAGYDVRDVPTTNNGYIIYGFDPNSYTSKQVNSTTSFTTNPAGGGTIPSGSSISQLDNRFRSYFANAGVTYRNKYTFSASGRIDQSNLFGVNTNQKSAPLWSAGLKWDIFKEPFYNIDWLNMLKARVTYGYSGNINNSITAYPTAIYRNTSGSYGSIPSANIATPGDPDLTWEKSGMLNMGIDFGLIRNIISGSFDYYLRSGKDLIGTEPLAASSGVISNVGNYSNMKGRGFDLRLSSAILRRKFKWNAEILVSFTANKVTKYLGTPSTNYTIVIGKPVSGLYGLKWAGLDPANGDPRGYVNDTVSKNYSQILTQPVTGTQNKFATTSSWEYMGSAQPTFHGGFRNTFSYKNFSVSANITFKAGYSFARSSINYNLLFGTWKGNRDYLNRWQQPGDELKTNVPSMPNLASIDPNRDNFYNKSTVVFVKGDNIRLQDITASYDFYKAEWHKLPVSYISIYSYINNIGMLWKANKYGLDPAYPTGGIPTPVSFAIGIKTGL